MWKGSEADSGRSSATKVKHTLALVGLAVAAQAAIVALAPTGKAQTRVPAPSLPIDVVAEGPANVQVGQSFGASALYDFSNYVTDTVVISGRLEEGAQYFGVSPTRGDLIGPFNDIYTVTLSGASPEDPLQIFEFLGADKTGLLAETTRVDIGDFTQVLSRSILARSVRSDVELSYRRPLLASGPHVTSVWLVSPNVSGLTQTQVLGTLEGAAYQSVVADGGVCQSVLAGFVCDFPDLGKLQRGVISTVLDVSSAQSLREAVRVATVGDVFTYTATTKVSPSDVVQPIEVELDVNPFSTRNVVKLSRRFVLFAVLSEPGFEVTEEVVRSSLRFGRTGLEDSVAFCFRLDLKRDGLRDYLCIGRTEAAGFQPGDTEAVMTGETFDGQPVRGTDTIQTLPLN